MINNVIGWWTHRREPIRDSAAYPQMDERLPVNVEIERAPQPVPYTEFWNVGRDAQHAWPFQRLYQSLAISDWLSVSGWPFLPGMKAHPSSLILPHQPAGWFNPQTTRSNIDAPPQTSLGMLTSVKAQTPLIVPLEYAKLV